MDLDFAVAWARHARWHQALIADADGVLRRELGLECSRGDMPVSRARSVALWHAHRELHREMLAEVEQELTNVELVVAYHGAGKEGRQDQQAILSREMERRGLISATSIPQ